MTRVKVCGITNLRDGLNAAASGADAVGFVFAKSPRRVSPARAAAISKALGPWIAKVGVFVNASPSRITAIARRCGLTAVQLHGDEAPADVARLKGMTRIKAFRVGPGFDWKSVGRFKADAYLFDTKVRGAYGGSGRSFDWKLLRGRRFAKPVILSGGLNPANVAAAVRTVRPYGVDASSGVERGPGQKDPKLVKRFIHNAKNA